MITLDKLASADYRGQLNQMSAAQAWAGSGERYAPEIKELATTFTAKTLLDYGCGPGKLRAALNEFPIEIREYDPGIVGKEALPDPADMVVCTDVLEHIEPDRLEAVLSHLHALTIKIAYFVIAVRPAEKRLPDGRNAHLIIDNARWWWEQLDQFDWVMDIYRPRANIDRDNAYFWARKLGGR